MDEIRRRLGPFGVWIAPDTLLRTPVPVQRAQFARIEGLGYGSLWSGEPPAVSSAGGREAFSQHGLMLAATERLVVGTGIANIGMRDPVAMRGGAATLAEAYPGRFILGLGGQSGERPLKRLREYLDAMDAATSILPEVDYPRVLAALGPKAHELAGERADGVHPFLQPLEHTALARKALRPGALLVPHQILTLDTDPDRARGRLRAMLSAGGGAMAESPYTRHYRRLGYGDDDLGGDRSDRFVDAVLAWGDEAAVADRLRAHLAAGADHVLLHPFAPDLPAAVDQLERLAPRLTG
ncbi:TIGR03620 family F420-dependent LLM class oxidoreductase [Spirillospora sp. NBC_01491]|uniref:TIGR03620 family F420-dependent LLM class oxidoreductase n=1 Tax=Spirillospora sp. NBC_01491 TaxID=2976007 RepID=UPI002E31A78B|nr:TIGR03620 family F420-dependent LLM class oxidoreductase [Spirillospora sp. NBC_01491]